MANMEEVPRIPLRILPLSHGSTDNFRVKSWKGRLRRR